jgi:hypothetical protein
MHTPPSHHQACTPPPYRRAQACPPPERLPGVHANSLHAHAQGCRRHTRQTPAPTRGCQSSHAHASLQIGPRSRLSVGARDKRHSRARLGTHGAGGAYARSSAGMGRGWAHGPAWATGGQRRMPKPRSGRATSKTRATAGTRHRHRCEPRQRSCHTRDSQTQMRAKAEELPHTRQLDTDASRGRQACADTRESCHTRDSQTRVRSDA